MSGVAAAIGVGVAGVELVGSAIAKHKDKKAEERLRNPFYKIQDEYFQDRNQAEQLASGGTPQAELNYETSEAEKGLGSSLDTILKSGGGINDASLLLHQYNENIDKIAGESAQQHIANIQYFHKLNADLAAQKTMQWSINEKQPYEQKLQELKQDIATDKQNEMNAITSMGSSAIAGVSGGQNAALLKKLLAKGDPDLPRVTMPSIQTTTTGAAPSPAAGVGTINPNVAAPISDDDDFTNIQGI